MTPAIAFLRFDDGVTVVTCVGCSTILHGLGMLAIVEEQPLAVVNAPAGAYCSRIYKLNPPYTIENCRGILRERHVGLPWGWR